MPYLTEKQFLALRKLPSSTMAFTCTSRTRYNDDRKAKSLKDKSFNCYIQWIQKYIAENIRQEKYVLPLLTNELIESFIDFEQNTETSSSLHNNNNKSSEPTKKSYSVYDHRMCLYESESEVESEVESDSESEQSNESKRSKQSYDNSEIKHLFTQEQTSDGGNNNINDNDGYGSDFSYHQFEAFNNITNNDVLRQFSPFL